MLHNLHSRIFIKCHCVFLMAVFVLKRHFTAWYCTLITGLCTKFELCSGTFHPINEFHSVLFFYRWTRLDCTHMETPEWLLSHWTHQDGLYPLDTPGWLVPPGHIRMACTQLDIPASLGHTWDGHTWKLRTHLEALDTSKLNLSQGISFGPFKTTPLDLHEPCQN